MGRRMNTVLREWLLKARIHPVPGGFTLDPQSAEYLYLVQQHKRLSLAASIGRMRPGNILLLPLIVPVILLKTADLWICNQMVRSMINERDLMLRAMSAGKPE